MEQITFDKKLIKQFDKMIHSMIENNVKNMTIIDKSVAYEDLYQEGLIYLNNACKIYSPTQGMAFSTFVYMHLWSRFGNTRRKNTRNLQKRKIYTFSDIEKNMSKNSDKGSDDVSFLETYENSFNFNNSETFVDKKLDIESVLKGLDDDVKRIFNEYFILGKKMSTIGKELDLSISAVSQTIKRINEMCMMELC